MVAASRLAYLNVWRGRPALPFRGGAKAFSGGAPSRPRRPPPTAIPRATAMRLVVLLGLVSLLADVTYEGSRSIIGPYLQVLGATGAVVGVVAGAGELIGYGVRVFSGYLSDRTMRYWAITLLGYSINLFAVPLLALAGNWPLAAALIVTERFGKGIRTPARDAMLSHATKQVGHGWGFGIHEALDQVGAVTGPLVVAAVLFANGGYGSGFAVLAVPALMAIAVLLTARYLYPRPHELEAAAVRIAARGFPEAYWMYLAAVMCIAAGFADFALIAFHFQQAAVVSPDLIPVFYAVAMGVDAIAALAFGRLYDRAGVSVLVAAVLLSFLYAPLAFLGGPAASFAGVVLWGVGMGAQESVMRATVAGMVPPERRGTAFGAFNTGFGVAWFAGSALMGFLYDASVPALVGFALAAQLASVPLFLWTSRLLRAPRGPAGA